VPITLQICARRTNHVREFCYIAHALNVRIIEVTPKG